MKILIASGIYPPDIGGPATYAHLLAEELQKRSIEVDVLVFSKLLKYPRILRHLIYFFEVLTKSFSNDLIFTQDPISTGIPVLCASFFSRKKVVMRVAGDYAWEQASQRFNVKDSIDDFQNKKYGFVVELLRSLQRFSVLHADIVITPSEYFNRLVSRWNNGKKRILTIYNGIDLDFSVKEENRFNKKTIISAGRLVPWKGFDLLIDSMQDLPDWNLIIAGDGPDKSRLTDLIKKNRLEDRVILLGNIPRLELLKKISGSHIFALLSTFESFSFQIVEAMYVGIPVVAGDIGNLREIIKPNEEGILIDPRKKEDFIFSVNRLEKDQALVSRLVYNARNKAREFSFEKTTEKLLAVFSSCIDSKR